MQRSVCIILLPLFLCTLFGSISPSYCYSDLGDSVLSVSFAVLGLDRNFTVMVPKTMMRGAKRLSEQCDVENRQNQQKIQQICSGEGFVATRTRCNRVDQVKSRRWKTVMQEFVLATRWKTNIGIRSRNAGEYFLWRFCFVGDFGFVGNSGGVGVIIVIFYLSLFLFVFGWVLRM